MLYQNGTCISQSECPCFSRGIEHPTGAKINEDCNTCTCKGGEWDCTKNNCDAVCKVKLLYKSQRFFNFEFRSLGWITWLHSTERTLILSGNAHTLLSNQSDRTKAFGQFSWNIPTANNMSRNFVKKVSKCESDQIILLLEKNFWRLLTIKSSHTFPTVKVGKKN